MRKQCRVKIRTEHSHSPKASDLFSAFWKSLPYVSLIIYIKKRKNYNLIDHNSNSGSTGSTDLSVCQYIQWTLTKPDILRDQHSKTVIFRINCISIFPFFFWNSAGKKQSFSAWKYIHFTLPMCNDVYFIGCQFSSFFTASAVYAQQRLSSHLKLQWNPALRPPRCYGHFFGRLVKTAIHFLVKKSSLIRPNIFCLLKIFW